MEELQRAVAPFVPGSGGGGFNSPPGPSGHDSLMPVEIPYDNRQDQEELGREERTLLVQAKKKALTRARTTSSKALSKGGDTTTISQSIFKMYQMKISSQWRGRGGTACIRPDSRAARSFVSALPLGLEAHLTMFVLSDCFCLGWYAPPCERSPLSAY
ncbi:hypothetical protein LIER_33413 [Lithospermum erythrorhizon]|uniref:Uncharacterized protein n=1 Tax=Lithospermum erythrorhizon TaxID=34254 RepID=A0AAV3S035_LITER